MNLSPGTKLVAGTGAVSRYKLSRSQKPVTVQDFNWGQMRVSGCNNHYQFVLGAGAKAKTVTNNLPILSVLGLVGLFTNCFKYPIFAYQNIFHQKLIRELFVSSVFKPIKNICQCLCSNQGKI
jgi:fluoride ion exporter CrcB/FEX